MHSEPCREGYILQYGTNRSDTARPDLIMAGDFNCVLSNLDCTDHRNSSTTLERLIQGLGLVYVSDASADRQICTHYTTTGAARLDRIYVSEDLRRQKQRWRQ